MNNRAEMRNGCDKTLVVRGLGQSMVEFALILPVMVLVVAGIFDLGRAFFASITITNAAREGARYGTLHPLFYDPLSTDACMWEAYRCIKNTAMDETVGSYVNLYSSSAVITVTCPDTNLDSTCDSGQPINVQIDYTYDDLIFKFFFPTGIPMSRDVEMMVP